MAELRWGIVGSGKVACDFTAALTSIGARVVAVGASSLEKATEFAKTHGSAYHVNGHHDL